MADRESLGIYESIKKYLEANFGIIYRNLILLFPEPLTYDILESAVGSVIEESGTDVSADEVKVQFTKAMDRSVLSVAGFYDLSGLSIAGYDSSSEIFTEILMNGYGFSKKTVQKLTGRRIKRKNIKHIHDESTDEILKKARGQSADIGCDFDEFWKYILKNEENKLFNRKKKSKGRLKTVGYTVAAVISLFLLSSFIYSFRPLIEGDMTYKNAMLRLLSRIPVPIFNGDERELYLEVDFYRTADDLKTAHKDCFLIDPLYYPAEYEVREYAYYLHEDGYTTGVFYNTESEYTFISVRYILRDKLEEHNYITAGRQRLGKVVTMDGVSFYVFKYGNRFEAAFFLGDVFTLVNVWTDYISINYNEFLLITTGIIKQYQSTDTD